MVTEEKTLVIGICDDEKYVHRQVQTLLDQYRKGRGMYFIYRHFFSGKEILEDKEGMDLLLLDICMPEIDGIEVAKRLRAAGAKYKIVLLTCMVERYKEGYKIGAFRFVTKPIVQEELFEAVDDVCSTMLGLDEIMVFADGVAYRILQMEVYYVMADEAQTKIFTKNYSYRSDRSLSQWEEELDERLFFRPHRAFLVNLSKIEFIDREIWLVSKERIPISRRNRKELLRAFVIFDTKYR